MNSYARTMAYEVVGGQSIYLVDVSFPSVSIDINCRHPLLNFDQFILSTYSYVNGPVGDW